MSSRRDGGWRIPVAVLGLDAVLAVLVTHGAWFGAGARWVGVESDPPIFMWYLRWVPWALGHGTNPLFTHHLDFPAGANLMANTSIQVPALLMAPVTALAGPVAAYNVLATAALALSAWCAFLALRRFTTSAVGAAAGGLLYGFSPYMLTQTRGHLNLSLALFPPLVLLLADEVLVRRRRSHRLLGVLLGLLVTAQLLTGPELLVTTTIAAALGLAILAALHRHLVRERGRDLLAVLGVATVVAAPLCAYPLWLLLLGPEHVSGLLHPNDVFVTDLVSLVRPGDTAAIGVPPRFPTPDSEAYVGVPLLLLAAVTAVALRRRRAVVAAALLATVMAVLSMGPRLHVDGTATALRLPWRLIGGLPVLENILPIRLMAFTYLMLGLIVAVALGRVLAARAPALRLAGAAAVGLALLPLLPTLHFPSSPVTTPAYFTSSAVDRIPAGTTALVTPILDQDTMLWQAEADLRFRMPEGGVYTPGPAYNTPPSALRDRLYAVGTGQAPAGPISGEERAAYLGTLAGARVETVLVGPPGQAALVRFLTGLLGRPPDATTGGVALWLGLPY